MAHIALPEGLPGISGGFAFRPETAKPMRELAHILLHEAHSLTPGERELIATYVSSQNDCYFCQTSHGAAAAAHLGNDEVVKQVKADFHNAAVTPKLKSLLAIAERVQRSGKNVTEQDVTHARSEGASDLEIHDTYSSPPPSACTTAMSMVSERGSRASSPCMTQWESNSRNTDTQSLHTKTEQQEASRT